MSVLLAARLLILDAEHAVPGGGVEIERGRVRRVLRSRRAVRRADAGRRVELEGLTLTPGLVNAHAHLELGALPGTLPGQAFVPWIRALIEARAACTAAEFRRAVGEGARLLLRGGTTTVGDVDSSGATSATAAALEPRLVVFREVLDAADPGRTAQAMARVARALPRRARVQEGLSPHAPYTTSAALLLRARALATRRRLPLQVHWAETAEEERWLRHGTGPLAGLLARSPRQSGLTLLRQAGLLARGTSLVHGNHPGRGELELLARSRVSLVHCPGTHVFFRRAAFPLERYRRAGVPVALGSDSPASNTTLDLRRELALLRRAFPRLAPSEAFRMATENGARALGLEGMAGRIRPGLAADLVAWPLAGEGIGPALEELTAGRPEVSGVWVAGRRARL